MLFLPNKLKAAVRTPSEGEGGQPPAAVETPPLCPRSFARCLTPEAASWSQGASCFPGPRALEEPCWNPLQPHNLISASNINYKCFLQVGLEVSELGRLKQGVLSAGERPCVLAVVCLSCSGSRSSLRIEHLPAATVQLTPVH